MVNDIRLRILAKTKCITYILIIPGLLFWKIQTMPFWKFEFPKKKILKFWPVLNQEVMTSPLLHKTYIFVNKKPSNSKCLPGPIINVYRHFGSGLWDSCRSWKWNSLHKSVAETIGSYDMKEYFDYHPSSSRNSTFPDPPLLRRHWERSEHTIQALEVLLFWQRHVARETWVGAIMQ